MDDRLRDLAARGYDTTSDPRLVDRARRRRERLVAAVVVLTLAAVPAGLALVDRVQLQRAHGALPGFAEALAEVVREHPEAEPVSIAPGQQLDSMSMAELMPFGAAAEAWTDAPPVDLPAVGVFGLQDPFRKRDPLRACVTRDPWFGEESMWCVPLEDPGAEPVELDYRGWDYYGLGPASAFDE